MKRIIEKGLALYLAVVMLIGCFGNVIYAKDQDTTSNVSETTKNVAEEVYTIIDDNNQSNCNELIDQNICLTGKPEKQLIYSGVDLEQQIEAQRRIWNIINEYVDTNYFLEDIYYNNHLESSNIVGDLPDMSEEEYIFLQNVALEATKDYTCQYDKIKAIVSLVSDRIYYDYEYYTGKSSSTYFEPYDVYVEKRTVCSGYASLVRTLCISIGIPCMNIIGYDHEYNAIYDSDSRKWIFADATWCSNNRVYYSENRWDYKGYDLNYCFDLTPDEIANLSNHEISSVYGLLEGNYYYSLQMNVNPYMWNELDAYLVIRKCLLEDAEKIVVERYTIDGFEIEWITRNAFTNCENLKVVDLSKLNLVGLGGFYNCNKLQKVYLPNTVTYIEDYAFTNCKSLVEIDLSKTCLEEIGYSAFSNCSKLSYVNFPDTLEYIYSSAFSRCSIEQLDLCLTNLSTIEMYAFSDNSSLECVWFPNHQILLENSSFSNGNNKIVVITTLSEEDIRYEKGNPNTPWGKGEVILADYGYIVNFDGNGAQKGDMHYKIFAIDLEIPLPQNKYELEGYYFTGWNTEKNGSGIWYTDELSVQNLAFANEEITLYAQWEKLSDGLYYDKKSDNWYYYVDGNIDYTYTGLVEYYGAWYYIENGILNWNYTGLTYYYGTWYYVENGVLNWNYTGLTCYYDTWYYIENGVLNWDYTGLTCYYDTWYYIENGVLNWNYTGLTYYYGTWYYVENSVLNWNYTGLTCYYDTWYYVENGVLNWNYIGLTCYYGTWYYVESGVLNWNYTGLTYYYDTWYYVESGVLNWNYTGLTYYYDIWYYVEDGVLNWNYEGFTEYYDIWYYVKNGIINWEFTGIIFLDGDWWEIIGGIRIGLAEVSESTWYDDEGFYYCMTKWKECEIEGETVRAYTGYVIAPATNFKIIVDGPLKYYASSTKRELANLGYYNSIWHYEKGDGWNISILVKSNEEYEYYSDVLRKEAMTKGFYVGSFILRYSNIFDTNGENCYMITAGLYE